MNNMNNDTICALATGGGISAIALIRISGKETINIVNKIFSKDLSKKETHTVHFGNIIDNKKWADFFLLIRSFNKIKKGINKKKKP